jgi:hypothetical protein
VRREGQRDDRGQQCDARERDLPLRQAALMWPAPPAAPEHVTDERVELGREMA